MIHVVLGTALCSFSNWVCCLTLRTNKQDTTAFCDCIAHENERLMQCWNCLGKVHDVDAGTLAVDVRLHAWVPAVSLVTEVNASFEQLTHVEVR